VELADARDRPLSAGPPGRERPSRPSSSPRSQYPPCFIWGNRRLPTSPPAVARALDRPDPSRDRFTKKCPESARPLARRHQAQRGNSSRTTSPAPTATQRLAPRTSALASQPARRKVKSKAVQGGPLLDREAATGPLSRAGWTLPDAMSHTLPTVVHNLIRKGTVSYAPVRTEERFPEVIQPGLARCRPANVMPCLLVCSGDNRIKMAIARMRRLYAIHEKPRAPQPGPRPWTEARGGTAGKSGPTGGLFLPGGRDRRAALQVPGSGLADARQTGSAAGPRSSLTTVLSSNSSRLKQDGPPCSPPGRSGRQMPDRARWGCRDIPAPQPVPWAAGAAAAVGYGGLTGVITELPRLHWKITKL